MWRRLRWVLLAIIVVLIGGAIAVGLTEQPKLDDDQAAVDASWNELRPALRDRYDTLRGAVTAFAAAGGGDRSVTTDLGAALSAWDKAVAAKDPEAEVEAANRLEAQASRLRVNAGTPRFANVQALTGAIGAFTGQVVPADQVKAYNRAVEQYQAERRSTLGALVARALGFEERPVLVLGG